eukprot:59409_1
MMRLQQPKHVEITPQPIKIHFLVYGHKGWIGTHIVQHIKSIQNTTKSYNIKLSLSNIRVDNPNEVETELKSISPTHIISCIGRTHGTLKDGTKITTIDYLESLDKTYDNIHDNLFAPMTLAILSIKYNIHFTYLGTGCIFHYPYDTNTHNKIASVPCDTVNDESKEYYEYDIRKEFTENDRPNFFGSQYSIMKGFTDQLMQLMEYNKNILNVRIRMPITDEIFCHRNLINKLVRYKCIVNIPNSMSNLDDLLPIMIDMALHNKYGTIHLVNPGAICHDEILKMYKEIIDNDHKWENISVDQLKKKCNVKANRSNNKLNTTKLVQWYPNVKSVRQSIRDTMLKIKQKSDQEQLKKSVVTD